MRGRKRNMVQRVRFSTIECNIHAIEKCAVDDGFGRVGGN